MDRIEPENIQTRQECFHELSECDLALARMDAQIQSANAKLITEGVYSDPHWWKSVQFARRMERSRRQRIQRRIGEINRESKRQRAETMNKRFIDAAMVVLDEETVRRIWDEVHREVRKDLRND